MSWHPNNPEGSVTGIKMAGYNFLFQMLTGALLIEFTNGIQPAMAAYGNQSEPVAIFVCVVCLFLVGLVSIVQAVWCSLALFLIDLRLPVFGLSLLRLRCR